VWFGTSEPDDSKGALPYDTYIIEELKCDSNKGLKLIPAFEIVVSKNRTVIDLGTLTDEYEKEIMIHTTATDKATGEKVIKVALLCQTNTQIDRRCGFSDTAFLVGQSNHFAI